MAVQSWAWWAGVGRSLAACGVTSLGCARWQRGPFHHDSRAATRKASSSPAARMQKTPAKLCSLRARPSGWGSACLSRSQRPFRGHHFCFIMSRSPFSCRSRILKLKGKWIVKRAELLICHCFLSNNKKNYTFWNYGVCLFHRFVEIVLQNMTHRWWGKYRGWTK